MKKDNNYSDVTAENFEEVILERDQVLIEFKAQWSGVSHLINPIIKGIAKIYQGSVDVYSFDTDSDTAVTKKYGVNKLPTLMFFNRGKPIDSIVGAHSRMEIIKRIESIYN